MLATTLEHRHYENAREAWRLFYEETTGLLLAIYADCRIIVIGTHLMYHVLLLLTCILSVGCTSSAPSPAIPSSEWTWTEWSGALLRGDAPGQMPPIPSSGWTHRDGHHSWFRDGCQIADYNVDGQIDYIRIVDPPSSFAHHIWVDRDYNGYFDVYPGAGANGETDPNLRVPRFEPANKPMQTDRPPAGR